jgi:hypothetical protein
VRNGRVLVGDPMLGLNEYSLGDFMAIWNGIGLAVVPGAQPADAAYNLASDWGPWSKAPLEGSALHVADDVTMHLPPSYQITPQLLLDVDVGTVN